MCEDVRTEESMTGALMSCEIPGSRHVERPKCEWTTLCQKNPGSIKDRNDICDLVCLEAKGGWESNLGKSCGMLALPSPAAVWRQAVT